MVLKAESSQEVEGEEAVHQTPPEAEEVVAGEEVEVEEQAYLRFSFDCLNRKYEFRWSRFDLMSDASLEAVIDESSKKN